MIFTDRFLPDASSGSSHNPIQTVAAVRSTGATGYGPVTWKTKLGFRKSSRWLQYVRHGGILEVNAFGKA